MSPLASVVGQFIVMARDRYGLGRFMPDELPLLDEMARLAKMDDDWADDNWLAHRLVAAEAERDAERDRADSHAEHCFTLTTRITAALGERDVAAAALKKFGQHRFRCAAMATAGAMFAPGKCNCGFDAALAALSETTGEGAPGKPSGAPDGGVKP